MPRSNSKSQKKDPSSSTSPATSKRSAKLPAQAPRAQKALVRLGIDPTELEKAAPISDILGSHGKASSAAQYLRSSSSEHAKGFLKFWDKIPQCDRNRLSLEAVCVGAKVSTTDLLGVLVMALRDRNLQKSTLKMVLEHPKVMDATLKSAMIKGPKGHADRKMIHSMPIIGFLPGPQGSQFNVNLGVLNAPQPQARNADDDSELSVNDVFPPITEVLEGWNNDRRKLLKSANV